MDVEPNTLAFNTQLLHKKSKIKESIWLRASPIQTYIATIASKF